MMLLKYPAHDVDSYIVHTPTTLVLLSSCIAWRQLPEETNLARESIDKALQIQRTLYEHLREQLEHRSKLFVISSFEHLGLPGGVELAGKELSVQERYVITEHLKHAGFEVSKVKYGSPEHNMWNQAVGD